eukprot:241931_1
MTTNNRKRSLADFAADSQEENEQSPSKKVKIDSNHNQNHVGRTLLEQSTNDLKDASNVTLDQIKNLFGINTKEFDNRYQVYQHFRNLSLILTRDLVLILPSKNKLFQFVEFEFYCIDGAHHNDVFAHCDDIQLATNASWYFHRSGNASAAGYKYMTDNKTHNKGWINPKPNAKYRNGTFKGCDITFGADNVHFGGILIRSMRELKPLNRAFSNDNSGCVVYSPASDIIEGPCRCVDYILKQSGFDSLNALTASKQFNLSIFGDDSNVMYVDLAKKYKIKSLAPRRVYKGHTNDDSIDYDQYFGSSPRVGLTLKKEKSLKGKELAQFQTIKKDFVMAPYRFIRRSCLPKIKKYKACIALSLMCRDYYYNKLHGQGDASWKPCSENASMLYNQKQLQNLIKQCSDGQENSANTIKDA